MEINVNGGKLKTGSSSFSVMNKEVLSKITSFTEYRQLREFIKEQKEKGMWADHYGKLITLNNLTMRDQCDINMALDANKIIFIRWTFRGCFYTAHLTIMNETIQA